MTHAVASKSVPRTRTTSDLASRWLGVLFTLALLMGPSPALSLQYKLVRLDQASMAFTFTGPIVPGDFERLGAFIQAAPSNVQLKAIFLDSGGGNLGEASRIAELFSKTQPFVVVMSGSQCTSACFLLFAAASQRAVAPDGLIGVHSASEDNGQEDLNSMAATTLFARDAAAYGVPPSIIGKLVETGSGRVTWLDPSDLASMHVQIIEANAPAPANPQPNNAFERRP